MGWGLSWLWGEKPSDGTVALEMQRDLQTLRLELHEAQEKVERLKAELVRAKSLSREEASDAVRAEMELLFRAAAGFVSQLSALKHQATAGTRPPDVSAVLAVSQQLIRVLEAEGLRYEGTPGEKVTYDPNLHEPVGDERLGTGQPVVVRFVGIWYRDVYVRRAGVESDGRV